MAKKTQPPRITFRCSGCLVDRGVKDKVPGTTICVHCYYKVY